MLCDPSFVTIPIYALVVPFAAHYFRRKVIRRAAKRPCDVGNLFRKPKISNLEVAVSIEQQVLRLQISVDDVHAMEIVKRECNFSGVELGDRVWEALERCQLRMHFVTDNSSSCLLVISAAD